MTNTNTPTQSFTFSLPPSWELALKDELNQPYIVQLTEFINDELKHYAPIYPPQELIFNALKTTPFEKVKVVIVGQDPYHGSGQAEGLSFSVPHGIPLPPSLKNIFKELKADLGIDPPSNGSLTSWAEQGVLLLNATLTVRQSKPMSHHKQGWETFTDAIIKALCQRTDPVVFVLWGNVAKEKFHHLNPSHLDYHLVLTAAHPSPFSAHQGFFGCRHFSKINEFLISHNNKPINWQLT